MIDKELKRFLITGTTNTAVCQLVYLALNYFVPYTLAYSGAYLFGVFFSYYLNTRWVFKVPMSLKTFVQYPLVYVLQYAIGIVLIYTLVDHLHCPEWLAPLAVVAMTVPATFLLSRFILKRKVQILKNKAQQV